MPKACMISVQKIVSCVVSQLLLLGIVHACCLNPLECIQADLSCNILYVGPRVCCAKAMITDIAYIVTVEVVRLFGQHQSTTHHGKPFPLLSAQKAKAACTASPRGRGSPFREFSLPVVCRNTLIPELQATAKPPSIVTMKKAIWMLYAQLTLTYLPSAFIGYAAYGEL